MKDTKKLISYDNIHMLQKVYRTLIFLNRKYPNFSQWFWSKVVPEIKTGQRYILTYEQNDVLIGIAILKSTSEEKKICTLYIKPISQNLGYGKQLLNDCLDILKTDRPIISVSEDSLSQFKKLFNHYNFELTQVRKGIYLKDVNEYVYNGKLE